MRVSIFSGPGTGKSTTASKIFSEFKIRGFSVELVHEYIKQWAYLDRFPVSFDPVYIFGKQLHAEDVVIQCGVKNIITDSPVMMQIPYSIKHGVPCWKELLSIAQQFEEKFPSCNIFLERLDIPYQNSGRYHNQEQAEEMDFYIKKFMDSHLPDYAVFKANDYDGIVDFLADKLD